MKFVGIASKMAITIGLGVYIGQYIDEYFETKTLWTIVFSLLFIGISLWQVIKDVSK